MQDELKNKEAGHCDNLLKRMHAINTLARYVRLRPHQWNNGIAMRFDVKGCAVARKISRTVSRNRGQKIL